MTDCFKSLVEGLLNMVPVLSPPAVGGAVAYLNGSRESFSWFALVLGMLTAMFVGWVVYLLLQTTTFHPALQSAVVSVAGYSSRDVLQLLKRKLIKAMEREASE